VTEFIETLRVLAEWLEDLAEVIPGDEARPVDRDDAHSRDQRQQCDRRDEPKSVT